MQTMQDTTGTAPRRFHAVWDINTAAAVIILFALATLIGIHFAFGGVVVKIGE